MAFKAVTYSTKYVIISSTLVFYFVDNRHEYVVSSKMLPIKA